MDLKLILVNKINHQETFAPIAV